MSEKDLVTGTVVNNRFRLEAELGSGASGQVFKATDLSNNNVCAVKLLVVEPHTSQEAVKRFIRESAVAGNLQHPNLVSIISTGRFKGMYYHVLELCEKGTLQDNLGEFKDKAEKYLDALIQVTAGVRELHNHNIVHRDLKSTNVLIRADESLCISDFGLARWNSADLTMTHSVGTPSAMAPEIWAGDDPSIQTDIYSLGVIFYETITGRQPFNGQSVHEVAHAHLFETPDPPSALCECPAELENLVGRMLAKQAKDRPSSTDEIIATLEDISSPGNKTDRQTHSSSRQNNKLIQQYLLLIACSSLLSLLIMLLPEQNVSNAQQFFDFPEIQYQFAHLRVSKKDAVERESVRMITRKRGTSDNEIITIAEKFKNLPSYPLMKIFLNPKQTPGPVSAAVKVSSFYNDLSQLQCPSPTLRCHKLKGMKTQVTLFPKYSGPMPTEHLPHLTWPIYVNSEDYSSVGTAFTFRLKNDSATGSAELVKKYLEENGLLKATPIELTSNIMFSQVLNLRFYFKCSLKTQPILGAPRKQCQNFQDICFALDKRGKAIGNILTITGRIRRKVFYPDFFSFARKKMF